MSLNPGAWNADHRAMWHIPGLGYLTQYISWQGSPGGVFIKVPEFLNVTSFIMCFCSDRSASC